MIKNPVTLLGAVLAILFLVGQSFFIVAEREQAMVFQFGRFIKTYQEPGLKVKIPFFQNVVKYPKVAIGIDTANKVEITLVGNRILVDFFTYYRITDPLVFFKNYRDTGRAAIGITSRLQEIVRDVLGNRPLADMLSEKRVEIMKNITDSLNKEVSNFGVEILYVRIRQADFPDQNLESIYKRMISDRVRVASETRALGDKDAQEKRADADRQRTVLLSNAEREAQALRGQGDATAIKIYADAFNADPKFYEFYRSLEAYRTTFAAQGGSTPTFVMSPDSTFLDVLNHGKR